MTNVFKMQMCVIRERKSTIFMYILMCGLVALNFIVNINEYAGYNVWNMYHPMRLVLLSDYSSLGFAFMQYIPFLLVVPAAFSFFNDRTCRENIIIEAKSNRKAYYIGTLLATFVTTFLIFTIPLLVELLLNCITFPLLALGEQSNISLFDNTSIIESYLFYGLWLYNPYLYTFLMILIFGVVCGIMACFAAAVSLIGRNQFKVMIFVPVYVLMYLVLLLELILNLDDSTNYFFYLRLFCVEKVNEWFILIFLVIVVFFIGVILINKIRKDELG